MIIRPDGIKIYEDGDKDVDLYQVVYNLNKDIRILSEIIDRALLKEQKAVKIEVKKINNSGRCGRCPNCLMELNEMDYPNFCGNCGQAVKWG